MVANFSKKSGLMPVTKENPCPHCGKPDWCYSIGELSVCNREQPPATGWKATSKTDQDGKIFYARPQEQKPIRPAATTYYHYPSPDGSPLVRVKRIDFGDGRKKEFEQDRWDKDKKCWLSGLGKEEDTNKVDRASIPIYRYAEVQEAKARGELIALVDGESCADTLWDLGLAATTSIGGMGKWGGSNTSDLDGAKVVVIVVDRDIPGIKDAAKVSEHFPEAQWLYPYPESKAWDNPPKSQGLDIKDWIEGESLSAADVLAAIGEKKVLQVSSAKPGSIGETNSNVVPLFPPMLFDLRAELTKLIKMGTAGSELTEAIFGLANGGNPQTIWRIYHEILEETERADQRLDRKRDVENLLKISNRRLTLENYLHPSLAEPIKKVATWMGVDPEAVLTHLLPIVAGLINPNSRVVAKECTNFVEPFLIYSGVVALSGARKTPTLNIPKNPLVRLQSVEDARYQQAIQIYDTEVQTLTETKGKKKGSGGELPQKPNPPREFYLDNATVEAVDKVKGQQPDHGLTLIKDELSGLFASHGAYKGGKGADKESYLSGWNGGGVKKNRSGDGSRVSLARDSLSITGGIQPDKLRALLGDFSDSQGEWARFLWYHMPMRPYKIPRDDTRYDLGNLLEGIYKKIDALPVLKLHFDKQGQTYWDDWHDKKDEQKRAEARPGLQAAIAKMPGQSVRLIGLLHVLWEVASGSADVPEEIPLSIVKSGCQLAEFYLGQVTLLQSQGDADTGELSPIFKKLLDKVAEFKSLTARQAIQTIRDLKQTKAPKVREFFTELKVMGLAETQGTGTRMVLVQKVLANSQESQKDQNPYSVDISENNTSKVLASVDKVLASNSQPQPHTESGFQDVKHQSVDTVDAIETFDLSPPSPELVEPIGLGEDKQVSEISNKVANTPTLSAKTYIEQAVEGVGKMSTVDANTFEIANTSPEDTAPIAPPESVAAEQKPERKTDDRVVAEKKHHKEFTKGDRVVITEVGNIHHGQRGEVTDISYGSSEIDYRIKLDKVSHNQEVIKVVVPKVSHTPILMQLKAEGGSPC